MLSLYLLQSNSHMIKGIEIYRIVILVSIIPI